MSDKQETLMAHQHLVRVAKSMAPFLHPPSTLDIAGAVEEEEEFEDEDDGSGLTTQQVGSAEPDEVIRTLRHVPQPADVVM